MAEGFVVRRGGAGQSFSGIVTPTKQDGSVSTNLNSGVVFNVGFKPSVIAIAFTDASAAVSQYMVTNLNISFDASGLASYTLGVGGGGSKNYTKETWEASNVAFTVERTSTGIYLHTESTVGKYNLLFGVPYTVYAKE